MAAEDDRRGETGLVRCVACAVDFVTGADPSYAFGASALCWDCAIRRGGVYDADADSWTEAPSVSDLAGNAYEKG